MNINEDMLDKLKYDQNGLIPAIVQDAVTGKVLMLAYMNRESLRKTLLTGKTCFYSRSRKKLWVKGETSGNIQKVKQILIDCDNDTLLVQVEQTGVACHTGSYSCFYRDIDGKELSFQTAQSTDYLNILDELTEVFQDRKINPKKDSYVCHLLASPGEKMPKKIVEEAAEVLIALKDKDREQIIYETADLLFHTLVALSYFDIPYQEILKELKSRRK
ncbi:MAG: bifunctional phosphoribosyl-AMP cyclohydrolase/phosphoribosyl-ATP diphosphatase HisIE [Atribacterota bacterium]|nr:bifunctional phosphoribosyl-AMP cyclohydrolase/phosphoribosyl-ATP diphosphatase HisIE [Atribacterota bacterium]